METSHCEKGTVAIILHYQPIILIAVATLSIIIVLSYFVSYLYPCQVNHWLDLNENQIFVFEIEGGELAQW